MYMHKIELRDWKAFVTAAFEFPEPTSAGNVCLVGAPNGYGKTSLLEAIILGLYGKRGLRLIARSKISFDASDRQDTSYPNFMKKALHKGALQNGRTSCSVKLTFVDDDGESIVIQRIWHFKAQGGNLSPNDEEVHIYTGPTNKAVGPAAGSHGEDRLEWYRAYIARRFAPHYLAAFFLYDGEHASALAERDMADQVRAGIEGLLGIPILRELADDLRKYAGQRLRSSDHIPDETMLEKERERATLEESLQKRKQEQMEVQDELSKLRPQQDNLFKELESIGVGTQAQREEQLELRHRCQQEYDMAHEKLENILLKDIPFSLAGQGLRKRAVCELESEVKLERWEVRAKESKENLENFLALMKAGTGRILPALSQEQIRQILQEAEAIWQKLWLPKDTGCADGYRYPYLKGHVREDALQVMTGVDAKSAPVGELLEIMKKCMDVIQNIQAEISRIEGVPNIDDKKEELKHVNGRIQELDQKLGGIKREIIGLEGQVQHLDVLLAQLVAKKDQAKPSVRRANRARVVAGLIDEVVRNSVPRRVKAIAAAMTSAFKQILHKTDFIDRIDIDNECNVNLCGPGGSDIREYDLSAGEKQIFTQALIYAVTSVAQMRLPMVIDTPLGRLDADHRKNILKHLANRDVQVILLSTDTEVVGNYLDEVEAHVCKKYTIEHEEIGDTSVSRVVAGYF